MAKRRPKIAFMMFQDVIMAVFGVLILIVVYLLLNAKISDIEFVESLNELESKKADLGASVERSQQDLMIMNQVVEGISKQRLNVETSKQKDELESQIDELEASITKLDAALVELQKQRSLAFERNLGAHPEAVEIQKRLAGEDRRLRDLKQQLKDLDREIADNRDQLKQVQDYLEDLKSKIRIELDEDLHGKNVYLLDLSARAMVGVMVGERGEVDVTANSIESLEAMLERDAKPKQVYFFVRPDGIERFRELQVRLREKGIALGYQPIATGEALVLSQIPTAPAYEPVVQSGLSHSGSVGGATTSGGSGGAAAGAGGDSNTGSGGTTAGADGHSNAGDGGTGGGGNSIAENDEGDQENRVSSTNSGSNSQGDDGTGAATSGGSSADQSAQEGQGDSQGSASEQQQDQNEESGEDGAAGNETVWSRYLFWLLGLIAFILLLILGRRR